MKAADTVGRIGATSTASSISPSGSIQRPNTGRKEKKPPSIISTATGTRTSRIRSCSRRSVRCRVAGTARDSASNCRRRRLASLPTL
jgi:hypothetical protein